MAYNSAFTGAQIDSAVSAVRQKVASWDGKADKPASVSVTLTAAGWDAGTRTQTVPAPGVLADETAQLIQPIPAQAGRSAYYGAGILCTAQAAGSLTFTAETVPPTDLTVYVVVQEVGA